jgi:hypothetical protein
MNLPSFLRAGALQDEADSIEPQMAKLAGDGVLTMGPAHR